MKFKNKSSVGRTVGIVCGGGWFVYVLRGESRRNRCVCDFVFFCYFELVGLDCVSIRFRATYVQTCQSPGRAGARPCSWGCCPRRAGGCCARWSRPPSGLCGSHNHWAVIAERTDTIRTHRHTQIKSKIESLIVVFKLIKRKSNFLNKDPSPPNWLKAAKIKWKKNSKHTHTQSSPTHSFTGYSLWSVGIRFARANFFWNRRIRKIKWEKDYRQSNSNSKKKNKKNSGVAVARSWPKPPNILTSRLKTDNKKYE